MRLHLLCGLAVVLLLPLAGPAELTLDLAGPWRFALDPIGRGIEHQWHLPDPSWDRQDTHPAAGWDTVEVPHDFLSDPRYQYTGVAWYQRSFTVPADAPADVSWQLEFDTVFQRCRVWLDGHLLGDHEGGYTPFSFLVTPHLRPGQAHLLVVEVDNRIRFRALPGARTPGIVTNSQLYPWLNYGGLLAGVRVVGRPPVHATRVTVRAQPDLASGLAAVATLVHLRNDRPNAREVTVAVALDGGPAVSVRATLGAGEQRVVTVTDTLAASPLWDLDAPHLRRAVVTVTDGDQQQVREQRFGVRHLEMRAGEFRLNGRAIRLPGANRARGHPVHGGLDPDSAVAEDLGLMKAAGLRFSRLQHTAPGRNVLDWADQHGILLILEVGMWGYTAPDQASPELRERFKAEMVEMIALAENHPSVVGWSLGNEYESWLPEGLDWTRDMATFVKELDPTRPVTFAALGRALRELQGKEPGRAGEHAFDWVDFISTNIYFGPDQLAEMLDPVHARWPDKPVFITEFGLRSDRVANEQVRIDHLDRVLDFVRARPWICGLSYWAFNDYASRYPATGLDGYRRWGLVDEHRQPRALYHHFAEQVADRGLHP